MNPKEWTVVYEHPEYGEAYVTWAWVQAEDSMAWTIVPVCVEYGFFVPPEEQEILTAELSGLEVNRVSVAAPNAPHGLPQPTQSFLLGGVPSLTDADIESTTMFVP